MIRRLDKKTTMPTGNNRHYRCSLTSDDVYNFIQQRRDWNNDHRVVAELLSIDTANESISYDKENDIFSNDPIVGLIIKNNQEFNKTLNFTARIYEQDRDLYCGTFLIDSNINIKAGFEGSGYTVTIEDILLEEKKLQMNYMIKRLDRKTGMPTGNNRHYRCSLTSEDVYNFIQQRRSGKYDQKVVAELLSIDTVN
jgi:hypothetical protein